MPDFGYTINKQRVIDLDKNDGQTVRRVRQLEPSINICIGCGTCTATCSANIFTEFNLRQLMLLVTRGETANLRKDIEKCMLCGKCMLACPRGVNTRNVLLAISRIFTENE
ncbi:MAG: 4Fe-4S dicluster domain-containing protein [Prevotellaceae bacterium]|jgi:heterodisulfide reductase subunit C|nr:4Fe-4S dicluster domain-containing protein [Prevotellaceae bacterium]